VLGNSGARLHRNLLITDNEISNFTGPAIRLEDVQGAVLSGNRLSWQGAQTGTLGSDEPIMLENTAGVRLGDNPVRVGSP
jgi:hypothetical protein